MINYNLATSNQKTDLKSDLEEFLVYLKGDIPKLILALGMILINSLAGIATPYFVAVGIDQYILTKNIPGLSNIVIWLGVLFVITAITGYFQTLVMGQVSQNTLLKLRNSLFAKIQELPVAFFNQNKTGDLISRINNDADKLNQFLSESLIRFAGNIFVILGIAIFICFLNFKLAILTLFSTVILVILTSFLSPMVKNLNKKSLESTGNFSGEVQEGLANFKVIVAFNRQDFFKQNFQKYNQKNFKNMIRSEFLNSIFKPLYDLAGYFSQLAILVYGIYLIQQNQLTIGFLVGFLSYAQKFYDPLRILGSLWGSIQSSFAAWSHLKEILHLENNLQVLDKKI